MKTTDYFCIRQVDSNGRIVVPKEIRERLGIIDSRTPLEMYLEEDRAIIKVHTPGCFLCGEMSDTIEFKGKRVCIDCIEKLGKVKELNED